MATEDRMSAISVKNRYNGQEEKHDFFSLVRHYENNFIRKSKVNGIEAYKLGEDGSPNKEVLKFKAIHSFGFSLDNAKSLGQDSYGRNRYDYFVSFMSLIGASGVLPQHYIKLSLERIKKGDLALSEFIGIFEHRLISLYYKSLAKYKLPYQFESTDGNEKDNFSQALRAFSGFSAKNTAQLFYSGHYSKSNRPIGNLQSIISELVGSKVTTQSLVGSWLPISHNDRCQIGIKGKNNHLGSGLILGRRYWDIKSKITIRIHDINIEKFNQLQKDKPLYKLLSSVVNSYVPIHIAVGFEFNVVVNREQVSLLGKGSQLGVNAWLMSGKKNNLISKHILERKH